MHPAKCGWKTLLAPSFASTNGGLICRYSAASYIGAATYCDGRHSAGFRVGVGVAVELRENNSGQRFWCSRGMIVTVRGPGDAAFSVHVRQPFARIGCGRFAEVRLPSASLSPCNLYLHATESGIYCLGLSELAPNGWLTPRAAAVIGPYRIKAAFDDDGPAPTAEAADLRKKSGASGSAPRLRVRKRGSKSRPFDFHLDRPLTVIGRGFPSTLRIAHSTVSHVHSALYWSGDSIWVVDLLSKRQTLLGQEPIDASLWGQEQTLTLGDFQIRYIGSPQTQRAFPLFRRPSAKPRSPDRASLPAALEPTPVQPNAAPRLDLPEANPSVNERNLLEALRGLLGFSGTQSGGGIEGPQEPLEALSALNQQLVFLADQDRSAPVPIDRPADLARTSIEDVRRSDGSVRPLEEELSAVSLTLFKVRQRLNIDRGPTSAEIGRLTDAIQGLEQRLAQMLEANRPVPKSAPAPLVGNDHSSSVELRQERAARPQPAGSSTLLFDDDSFMRLVKLSKRELLAPHRKLYWTAATAAAVALILTAAGAARQWLNGASLDGPGAQPPPTNYADRVKQDRSPSEAAGLTR